MKYFFVNLIVDFKSALECVGLNHSGLLQTILLIIRRMQTEHPGLHLFVEFYRYFRESVFSKIVNFALSYHFVIFKVIVIFVYFLFRAGFTTSRLAA